MDTLESPIGAVDSIDIIGVRKDGGIDTIIVCPTCLDDSNETLHALRTKTQTYLRQISSKEFIAQYGTGPVKIFIACDHAVSGRAMELIDELALEAANERVLLVLGSPVA